MSSSCNFLSSEKANRKKIYVGFYCDPYYANYFLFLVKAQYKFGRNTFFNMRDMCCFIDYFVCTYSVHCTYPSLIEGEHILATKQKSLKFYSANCEFEYRFQNYTKDSVESAINRLIKNVSPKVKWNLEFDAFLYEISSVIMTCPLECFLARSMSYFSNPIFSRVFKNSSGGVMLHSHFFRIEIFRG